MKLKNDNKTAKNKTQKRNFAKRESVEEERKKEVVRDVMEDFESRRAERKSIENNFLLCMNFVLGNQHSYVTGGGDLAQEDKLYAWETREVYNHIAPIVETRLAKLGRVRPHMHVRPTSSDEDDILAARMSTALLSSSAMRSRLDELIADATLWSEVCGTSFYKIGWNSGAGCLVGETEDGAPIFEGDVDLTVCPPFEIFPASCGDKDVEHTQSIIHARAVDVDEILSCYGVELAPEDIDIFTFDRSSGFGGICSGSTYGKLVKSKQKNSVLVIERYTRPTHQYPLGRLEIVAGGELLFEGELPFVTPCGERYLPFVRQISLSAVGSFWGAGVVERCIPLQRAYNSIKNRKHELLTRLAAGVLIVEDGSVDMDDLEQEGLCPGKMLVYRNGATPPRFMDDGSIPAEFTLEENRILEEFVSLSGVSEFSRSSVAPTNVSSGVALGLLVEQDDTRLAQTADYIRFSVRAIAKQILAVVKQFGSTRKLLEVAGKNGELETRIFESSHITSDDVCLDTENEMSETPSSRKAMVLDLLRNGLLNDESGRLSERMRIKVLEALGFGSWENTADVLELQQQRARRENYGEEKPEVLSVDDHSLHIQEHTKWILENTDSKRKEQLLNHIGEHKIAMITQNATN